MSAHPAIVRLLAAMPWLTVAKANMADQGRYYPECETILVRRGLRGGRYNSTVVHEAVHAQRGDAPCADPASEALQEMRCERDAARLLIDVHDLADAAAAYPDDPHHVAEMLAVDYDTLAVRMKHLHPAERGYLKRRLAHTEETA